MGKASWRHGLHKLQYRQHFKHYITKYKEIPDVSTIMHNPFSIEQVLVTAKHPFTATNRISMMHTYSSL